MEVVAMRMILSAAGVGLTVACSGQPAVEAPAVPEAPLVRSVADYPSSDVLKVWPGVELVPQNGLTLHVQAPEPVVLGQHDFSVYRIDGDEALEVVGALERWHWNEDRTEARLEPKGLVKGAPYLLAGEGLVADSGREFPRFGHRFRVMPADTTPPSGARVRVLGDPQPGTRAPLRIPFDEAVQRGATRQVTALANGVPQSGEWALSADQRELRFTPAEPWPDGLVVVSMNVGIRDLGGNELIDLPGGMLVPMVPVGP